MRLFMLEFIFFHVITEQAKLLNSNSVSVNIITCEKILNEDVESCAWKIFMEVVDFSIHSILKWLFNSLKLFDSTLFLSQAFRILCLFPAKITFFNLFMRLFNDVIELQQLSACCFHAVVRGYFSLLKEKCSRCTSPALFLSPLVWSHYYSDQHLRTSGLFVHRALMCARATPLQRHSEPCLRLTAQLGSIQKPHSGTCRASHALNWCLHSSSLV